MAKATYGWFNEDLLNEGYALQYSPNQLQQWDYRWHDLNGDKLFEPGEVNLDPNGPDFVSVSGAPSTLNPNLKPMHTHEVTASLERELAPALSLRGLFVYKRQVDALSTAAVNTARPFSVYDQSFNRQDPGPDGVLGTADDGGFLTIYDYNPAYRGAAFVNNTFVNADSNRQNTYKSFEVMLTKRSTGRWFVNTSVLGTRNHQWRVNVVTTPNDNIFPVDNYWDFAQFLSGGYSLPFGINISALNQLYNGLARQRVVVFRAVDPAGGPRFPSSSTITLPVAPRGSIRGPVRNILNFRVGKDFKFNATRKISASVDAFNALNTNVAWGSTSSGSDGVLGITETSGPTYNQVYGIVQPRMLRFNLAFEF